MPPGQAWTDCPGLRKRWIPSQSLLAATGPAAALKHEGVHQSGPVVEGSTGELCWAPSQSHPQLVSGAQVGAATARFGVFFKCKAILEVLGFPSTRYNKLHEAQSPCPVQKLQAGRKGSTPALEIRQKHVAEPLHEGFPPAQPCAPAANPCEPSPGVTSTSGCPPASLAPCIPWAGKRAKHTAERGGGAWREAAKPHIIKGHVGKAGVKETQGE